MEKKGRPMSRKKVILTLLAVSAVLMLILSACGGRGDENEEDPNAAITAVVETAMSALTQTAAVTTSTPSLTPTEALPTNTPVPSLTPSQTPGNPTTTSSPPGFVQPTNQTSSCDIGTFVRDVTVPDGKSFAAGEEFTKTWEIKNNGTCTWNENYLVIFYSGTQLAEDAQYKFTTEDIEPGENVQISIPMTAPTTMGEFTSYWILRNDLGQNFFVDGSSIYAQIQVGTVTSATATPTEEVPNADPVVTITGPATTTYTVGDVITFSGTAEDAEDGPDISNLIDWTSDIDGYLGTGKSINVDWLSEGTHTITATIQDNDGATDSATIDVTVNPAP
jgi:hypothetical protein